MKIKECARSIRPISYLLSFNDSNIGKLNVVFVVQSFAIDEKLRSLSCVNKEKKIKNNEEELKLD